MTKSKQIKEEKLQRKMSLYQEWDKELHLDREFKPIFL